MRTKMFSDFKFPINYAVQGSLERNQIPNIIASFMKF